MFEVWNYPKGWEKCRGAGIHINALNPRRRAEETAKNCKRAGNSNKTNGRSQ
jgi:hypothetical protein